MILFFDAFNRQVVQQFLRFDAALESFCVQSSDLLLDFLGSLRLWVLSDIILHDVCPFEATL